MIDYCCFASSLEGRICESTTHLHEFFEDEVTFSTDDKGHIRYVAPVAPGFGKFKPPALRQWVFPEGSGWHDPVRVLGLTDCTPEVTACIEGLKAKAVTAIAEDKARAEAVL